MRSAFCKRAAGIGAHGQVGRHGTELGCRDGMGAEIGAHNRVDSHGMRAHE